MQYRVQHKSVDVAMMKSQIMKDRHICSEKKVNICQGV